MGVKEHTTGSSRTVVTDPSMPFPMTTLRRLTGGLDMEKRCLTMYDFGNLSAFFLSN